MVAAAQRLRQVEQAVETEILGAGKVFRIRRVVGWRRQVPGMQRAVRQLAGASQGLDQGVVVGTPGRVDGEAARAAPARLAAWQDADHVVAGLLQLAGQVFAKAIAKSEHQPRPAGCRATVAQRGLLPERLKMCIRDR